MTHLRSGSEYAQLLDEVQVRQISKKKGYNNCYITVRDADALARQGRMQYERISGGVLFLSDQGTFYKLQLYMNALLPFILPKTEKPVVTDLVYRKAFLSEEQRQVEELLINAGMRFRKELCEYAIGIIPQEERKKCEDGFGRLCAEGFTFDAIDMESVVQAYNLLNSVFDVCEIHGLFQMDWERICSNRGAFCVRTPEGEICAVNVVPAFFRGGLTAVNETMRGRGIGRALNFYSYHLEGAAKPNDHLWIASYNTANIRLTESMGGHDTGRRSRTYARTS